MWVDMGSFIYRECFCCEKYIEPERSCCPDLNDDRFSNPPDNATFWRTTGNWGSSIFDSFGEETLEIYICDECLKKKAKLAYFFETNVKVDDSNLKTFDEVINVRFQ